jgi:nucleotide-binding universal stress UspA family protein
MHSGSVDPSKVYVGNLSAGGPPVRILVAIDSRDDSTSEENERILRQAAKLAERAGGELHVASAYPACRGDAVRSYRVERYLPALRVKARDRRRSAIRQLLRRLKIANAFIHVEEGDSRQVIDALASSLQAIVVGGAQTRPKGSAAPIDGSRLPEHVAA